MGFFDALVKSDINRTRSEKMYDDALKLFNSAQLQNETLPPALKAEVEGGEDCDVLSQGSGRFGHDMGNPIPVNGPFGEMTYLSRLRLRSTGSMVFFHKVETIGRVASRRYPEGYTLEKEAVFPRGVTTTVPDFPAGLYKLIKKEAKQRLGVDVAEKESDRIDVEQAQASIRELRKL